METSWGARVGRVLPKPGQLLCTPIEAHLLLEIAYLAMAADLEANEIEQEAFAELSKRLKSLVDPELPPPSEMDIGTVLATFADRAPPGRQPARIREIALQLGGDRVRWLAYQLAFAMTLVDLDTTPEEIEIEAALRKAFDISDAKGDELRKEVFRALEH